MSATVIVQVIIVDACGVTTQTCWTGGMVCVTDELIREAASGLMAMANERYVAALMQLHEQAHAIPVKEVAKRGLAGPCSLTIDPDTGTCAPAPGKNKAMN